MTPEEVAQEMERKAAALERAIPELTRQSLQIVLEATRAQSIGALTASDLRRLGHPYARRRVTRNPNVINRRTGEFLAGWAMEMDSDGQGGRVFQTSFKARGLEAGLVFGRPLMVERHPEKDALVKATPALAALQDRFIRNL